MFFTLGIEFVGALALCVQFKAAGVADPLFTAVFHSVSAFCNAGFSVFSTNLEGFSDNIGILSTISALIVTGGIGFIVIQDIERRARGKRRRLSYHTKVVLAMTSFLIVSFALAFLLLERRRAFAGLSFPAAIANAFFQSITPRTAGFDAVVQSAFSQPSKVLTILLMFIGGAPGSIAGGIKVTTAFVIAAVMAKRPDGHGDITVFKRRLSARTTNDAVVYFLKAAALLAVAAGSLSLIEGLRGVDFSAIIFETVSAFGTVGLSLGITGSLSDAGKLVIIATMFAGRVGLIALAFPALKRSEDLIVYPEGSILLG
jgi:trk system potassium uptake protein TrkH